MNLHELHHVLMLHNVAPSHYISIS